MDAVLDYEIRWLTSADESVLDRVAPDVFDEPIDPIRRAAYLADPRHHMAVAIMDGEVVAQVAGVVYRHPDKTAELFIDEVGVTPALRRRGIARALLNEMLARGKALGCGEALGRHRARQWSRTGALRILRRAARAVRAVHVQAQGLRLAQVRRPLEAN
jgi:GNAT superfamily N-acetyltransferase